MGATADDRVYNKLDTELRDIYLEIGKTYYAEHKGKTSNEQYKDLFERVLKLETEKNNLELRKLAQQGKRRCPACKSILTLESRFCNMCGEKLPDLPSFDNKDEKKEEEENEVKIRKCSTCGMELEEGAAFCPNCGTKNEI